VQTTVEYLDAVKVELGLQSDYAASKALGVTRGTISRYRLGTSVFDDDLCFAVAMILDLNPFEVLIDAHVERAKDARTKAKWLRYWKDFSTRFTVERVSRDEKASASQTEGRRKDRPLSRVDQYATCDQDCEFVLSTAIDLLQQVRNTLNTDEPPSHEQKPRRRKRSDWRALDEARQVGYDNSTQDSGG
jgi:hypothetical protein